MTKYPMDNSELGRRAFFSKSLYSLLTSCMMAHSCSRGESFFATRGVVISPDDLSLRDWAGRARKAGLTTIALHHMEPTLEFIQTDEGMSFLENCASLGLNVEYEFHAMNSLLPRKLFDACPGLFRENEEGSRTPDYNFCSSSRDAIEIICENAVKIGRQLSPGTGRYFFWIDDGRPMCFCRQCRELSAGEQALLLENAMVKALRLHDPRASLAHLAYANTIDPPRKIKPHEGVFLEFAPIGRKEKIVSKADPLWEAERNALIENLKVFPAATAQVLEYWLDCSMWSGWEGRENQVKIPWNRDRFEQDVQLYSSLGVRNITTFAVYVDNGYVTKFGDPPLDDYGRILRDWKPRR